MSNAWFQFRQFMIRQDQSAMKVGTDGVLLGAWADCSGCETILDVGTGTGLIAVMLAQRNSSASIIALEIDPAAAGQAVENIRVSPWSGRVKVIQSDFLAWKPEHEMRFDLVVCNPPFFSRSLKNPDLQRAAARHDDGLPLAALVQGSAGLLSEKGRLVLILPAGRFEEVVQIAAESGLYLNRRLDVRGHINAPVKRILVEWGRVYQIPDRQELIVETGTRGVYSDEYRLLTGEFYL